MKSFLRNLGLFAVAAVFAVSVAACGGKTDNNADTTPTTVSVDKADAQRILTGFAGFTQDIINYLGGNITVGPQSLDTDNMFDMSLWQAIECRQIEDDFEEYTVVSPNKHYSYPGYYTVIDNNTVFQYEKQKNSTHYVNGEISYIDYGYKQTYTTDSNVGETREENARVMSVFNSLLITDADLVSMEMTANADGTAKIEMTVMDTMKAMEILYTSISDEPHRNFIDFGGSKIEYTLRLNADGEVTAFDTDILLNMEYEYLGNGIEWTKYQEDNVAITFQMKGVEWEDIDLGAFADLTQFYPQSEWTEYLNGRQSTRELWDEFAASKQN